MAGEFPSITKEIASRKNKICQTDLFSQNKHDHHDLHKHDSHKHDLFLQIFSQVFEK